MNVSCKEPRSNQVLEKIFECITIGIDDSENVKFLCIF